MSSNSTGSSRPIANCKKAVAVANGEGEGSEEGEGRSLDTPVLERSFTFPTGSGTSGSYSSFHHDGSVTVDPPITPPPSLPGAYHDSGDTSTSTTTAAGGGEKKGGESESSSPHHQRSSTGGRLALVVTDTTTNRIVPTNSSFGSNPPNSARLHLAVSPTTGERGGGEVFSSTTNQHSGVPEDGNDDALMVNAQSPPPAAAAGGLAAGVNGSSNNSKPTLLFPSLTTTTTTAETPTKQQQRATGVSVRRTISGSPEMTAEFLPPPPPTATLVLGTAANPTTGTSTTPGSIEGASNITEGRATGAEGRDTMVIPGSSVKKRSPNNTLVTVPCELLLAILALATELDGSVKPVASFSLVCHQWYRLCCEPFLWDTLAKRFFVSFPLIQTLTLEGGSATPTPVRTPADHGRTFSTDSRDLQLRSPTPTTAAAGGASGRSTAGETPKTLGEALHTAFRTAQQKYAPQTAAGDGSATAPSSSLRRRRGTPNHHHESSRSNKKNPGAAFQKRFTSSPACHFSLDPSKALRPSRMSFLQRMSEVAQNHLQQRHQQKISKRRGPILHALVSLSLFCVSMAGLVAMLALEGVESSALNAETCFQFCWATYCFVFLAVVVNIVMKAHYEPQPLVSRIRRHMKLIMTSVAALVVSVVCVAGPLYTVQLNTLALAESIRGDAPEKRPTRADWMKAGYPLLFGLLVWLAEILFSVKAQVQEWWADGAHVTLRQMYDASAYCTPIFFMVAVMSAVEACVEPTSGLYIALGTAPLFITFSTLSVVFAIDFGAHHKVNDLLSAIWLGLASLFPVCAVAFPLRGLTLAPLVLASTGFYLTHLNTMRKNIAQLENGEEGDVTPDESLDHLDWLQGDE